MLETKVSSITVEGVKRWFVTIYKSETLPIVFSCLSKKRAYILADELTRCNNFSVRPESKHNKKPRGYFLSLFTPKLTGQKSAKILVPWR